MSVGDLVYCEDYSDYLTLQGLIKAKFPDAKFEDGSDYIHEHRFSFESELGEPDDFIAFAIKEGFAFSCFAIQLLAHTEPERIRRLAGLPPKESAPVPI